jgi:hypothetical protein
MEYYPNAISEKTKQGGDVLSSFVCAVIAACVVGHFGSGAPWWVYALLFVRFVGAVARVMTDDTSLQNANCGHAVRGSAQPYAPAIRRAFKPLAVSSLWRSRRRGARLA